MESRFACFYLTGQLEWILRKFQLAEVVLVVSKPHDFNLTGQLVSTPPVFPTLAATHPPTWFQWDNIANQVHQCCESDRRRRFDMFGAF